MIGYENEECLDICISDPFEGVNSVFCYKHLLLFKIRLEYRIHTTNGMKTRAISCENVVHEIL